MTDNILSGKSKYYEIRKNYDKYGFWGLAILALSVLSIIAGIVITIIFVTKISNLYSVVSNGENIDNASTEMIGTFFGGIVGPIWSFSGILLFFLALRLQSKELSLQINELKMTREVFTTQQFESTFFNLLKTQQDIRQTIEIQNSIYQNKYLPDGSRDYSPVSLKSNMVFQEIKKFMFDKIEHVYQINKQFQDIDAKEELTESENKLKLKNINILKDEFGIDDYKTINQPLTKAKLAYSMSFKIYHNQLAHYYRNLYHILNYLLENEEKEKQSLIMDELSGTKSSILINGISIDKEKIRRKYKRYSEFVQAQMSGDELFLLFYNGLFFKKMKKILHHYDFLENLSSDDLLNPEEDFKFYKKYNIQGLEMEEIIFKSRKQILKI